jgi:hypothetical protein
MTAVETHSWPMLIDMGPIDAFENAKAGAKPDCPKCHGTGSYMYDHNHSTVCDLCCKHNAGFWQLSEHHANPGDWCCLAGCGMTLKFNPDDVCR